MPVSSLSGSLSTSVYLASLLILLVVIAGPAKSAYDGASLRAAQELATGVANQIDALNPGMVSSLRVSSMPGTSITVHFSGSEVTATVNGASASSQVRWSVSGPPLQGGKEYTVAFLGDVVRVA